MTTRNMLEFPRLLLLVLLPGCRAEHPLQIATQAPYIYVMPGDLSLGVFQNVLVPSDGGTGCDNTSLNLYALHCCEGALYAAEQINFRDDLLPGLRLGLVCLDTCSNAITSLGQAVRMLQKDQRRLVGVVGSGMSRLAVATSNFFEVFQIPLLGPYESSDELSDKSRFGYFSRIVSPDRFQAEVFVDLIRHFNWSYVGLVYSETTYGEYGARRVEVLMKERHLCLAYSHAIPVEPDPGQAEAVVNLLETYPSATAVVWFVDFDVSSRVLAVLEDSGATEGHILLMSDSAYVLASTYPRATHGALVSVFVTPPVPNYDLHYLASFNRSIYGNDLKYWHQVALQAEYQCDWEGTGNNSCLDYKPNPQWFDTFAWVATNYYEATYVFAHALHEVIMAECPGAVNGSALEACIRGPELLATLRGLRMEGVTGQVVFDKNGDRLPRYDILHFYVDEDGQQVKINAGVWDKYAGSMKIDVEELVWAKIGEAPASFCSAPCQPRQYKIQHSPHCCWDCRSCRSNEILSTNGTQCNPCPLFTWPDPETATVCVRIPPTFIRWSQPTAVSIVVFAVAGVVVSLTFINLSWQHRKSRLIKSTNKELSFLILISTTLAFINAILFIPKPTTAVCFLRGVGFHLVVSLLYAPLLVKTVRVYIIFNTGKKAIKAPMLVSLRAQRFLTSTLILLQVLLLVAVHVHGPPTPELLMPVHTEPYVELTCRRPMLAFLLPLAYNVLSILLCAIFGYSARKLPDNYNESGFIFVSVATTLFAWVVLLPTLLTARSSEHQAAILALCLMLNAFITLGCLFAPKMYAVLCVDEANIRFSTVTNQSTAVTQVQASTA